MTPSMGAKHWPTVPLHLISFFGDHHTKQFSIHLPVYKNASITSLFLEVGAKVRAFAAKLTKFVEKSWLGSWFLMMMVMVRTWRSRVDHFDVLQNPARHPFRKYIDTNHDCRWLPQERVCFSAVLYRAPFSPGVLKHKGIAANSHVIV